MKLDVLVAEYHSRFGIFFRKVGKKGKEVFDFDSYSPLYWKVANMYVDVKCRETVDNYRINHGLLNYYLGRSPKGLVKKLMEG